MKIKSKSENLEDQICSSPIEISSHNTRRTLYFPQGGEGILRLNMGDRF